MKKSIMSQYANLKEKTNEVNDGIIFTETGTGKRYAVLGGHSYRLIEDHVYNLKNRTAIVGLIEKDTLHGLEILVNENKKPVHTFFSGNCECTTVERFMDLIGKYEGIKLKEERERLYESLKARLDRTNPNRMLSN